MFASFNLYTYMAHYVGKTLHIRPNEILDSWGVPELIVAFGEYANEVADKNFREWRALSSEVRSKQDRPPRWIVQFIDMEELEVENG